MSIRCTPVVLVVLPTLPSSGRALCVFVVSSSVVLLK